LWRLLQEGGDYEAQCAIEIKGPAPAWAVKKALSRLIERHEILRTRYVKRAGIVLPLQVIDDHGGMRWSDDDRGELDEEAIAREMDQQRAEGARYQEGDIVRAKLIGLGGDRKVLVLSVGAMNADAETLRNIVEELSLNYAELVGVSREKRSDVVQYIRYSEWQNEIREESGEGREFWKERETQKGISLNAPYEQAATRAGFRVGCRELELGEDMSRELAKVARDNNSEESEVLLACWLVLMWRLTPESEIVFAHTVEAREYEMLQGAIGLFARSLPIRCRFHPRFQVREVIRQIRHTISEANDWQEHFAWESCGQDGLAFPSIAFEAEPPPIKCQAGAVSFRLCRQYVCVDRFKLKLSFRRAQDRVAFTFSYDRSLFCAEDVDRLAGQYLELLSDFLVDPGCFIGDLEILSRQERRRLIVDFNDTRTEYSTALCIHDLIRARAELVPGDIAVVSGGNCLTYGDLNTRANNLAWYLRRLGVGPESLVTILVDRSLDFIIGMLGTLKAGGAYVPLDTAQPVERLSIMLEESRPSIILTQQRFKSLLADHNSRVVCLDSEWESIGSQRDDDPGPVAAPENLAYVIFTSGSTGRPKGVAVGHTQLFNYVSSIIDRLDIPEGASFALVSTFAADLGHTMLFPSLVTGGQLHIISQEEAADGNLLADYFSRNNIDCLKIVRSHLKALLSCYSPEKILPKRRLILGGETCHWSLVDKIRELAPGLAVFNHYGPTETCVGVLTNRIDDGLPGCPSGTVPLGRPIANTQVYLLDDNLRPVPVSLAGELYVGGAQVSHGYLRNPEATAEKFLPDPFSGTPGGRLYRTGDLARHLPDGKIEFLGRVDNQEKIRGYRIELGEIESSLLRNESVKEAAVIAIEDAEGDKKLVAYIVPEREQSPLASELRLSLQQSLPDYMLPSSYMILQKLPLTPNGKLDRQSLPKPDQGRPDLPTNFQGPRNPIEELVAEVWATILRIKEIGIEDNFFDLGGHSLLATQVISRLTNVVGVNLPLRELFEHPTVAELAGIIKTARNAALPPRPAIKRVSREAKLPVSYAQQRLWFLEQFSPGASLYNVPAGTRLKGSLNAGALTQALCELNRRHETLRTSFETADGLPVQIISPPRAVQLPVIDLSALPPARREAEARRLSAEEARRPFDLTAGPLARFNLLSLDELDNIFLFTLHHAISDGWSRSILVREVVELYLACLEGRPSSLKELPIQYADYAAWQRNWIRGEVLDSLIDYWKRQMSGAAKELKLPTVRPRTALRSNRGGGQSFALQPELSLRLKALGRREGVTQFMLLMAAFQSLLHYYSRQEDIIVGTPTAGRSQVETEGLVGFFLNTLPIRISFSNDPTFREVLVSIREVFLDAYAHQDLPFEKMVEALQPDRQMSHSPIFQVWFAMLNTPLAPPALPDLALSVWDSETSTAQFDLELLMWEGRDQINGQFKYDKSLFDQSTIKIMSEQFDALLTEIVNQPEIRMSRMIDVLTGIERERQMKALKEHADSSRKELLKFKPKAVKVARNRLVSSRFLDEQTRMPLVFEPAIDRVSLIDWVGENLSYIESELVKHGAILFRGFKVDSPMKFEQLARTISPELLDYYERTVERQQISKYVYTSSEYPMDHHIPFHNEYSFTHEWPMKLFFYCLTPSASGGQTPIADSRKVYQLIEPRVSERFIEKKIMYVRNYGEGLDLDWKNVFQAASAGEVEEYCHKAGIIWEWKDANRLKTSQVRQAAMAHPKSGEIVWFNQAHLFHVSSLAPTVYESMLTLFREDEMPRNAFYGDGTPIELSVLEQIRDAYRQASVTFDWRQNDVLLLDNMLVAHGRAPFAGPRKIAVSMAELFKGESSLSLTAQKRGSS
jgi:amino acid adenylation domain-containing protein